MNDKIPVYLKPVLDAVDVIAREFESAEDFRLMGDNRWLRDLDRACDEDVLHAVLILDADAPLLAVYVILRGLDNARHRDALAKGMTRANYGLLPGCFELDFDTGEARYRSVLSVVSPKIAAHDVAQLLSGALLTAKAYAPALRKIAKGADPIQAIDAIEN